MYIQELKKQKELAQQYERKAMEARHNAEEIAYKFIIHNDRDTK